MSESRGVYMLSMSHVDGIRSLCSEPDLAPVLGVDGEPSRGQVVALVEQRKVAESRLGWPEPDSVFVRLRKEFLTNHPRLPEGVHYEKLNDPHWWAEEYRSERPQHIIASR